MTLLLFSVGSQTAQIPYGIPYFNSHNCIMLAAIEKGRSENKQGMVFRILVAPEGVIKLYVQFKRRLELNDQKITAHINFEIL